MREFYEAFSPRLEEAIDYCDKFPLADVPDDALNLLHLIYSMVMVSMAVEVFGQQKPTDSADAVIDHVSRFAPNFKAAVLGRRILSPLDLEREFGLFRGDIFHGKLTLNQLFSARPVLGYADYRMPLRNLYLCGAGAHPGGGVSGVPGHNAARQLLRDWRRGRIRG